MSLELSRRSFLKCSAAAAVMVACSGMLTGCDDANKPVLKGTGTITLAQAKITVLKTDTTVEGYQGPTYNTSDGKFSTRISIYAGRENTYSFEPKNFYVGFYKKDGSQYKLLAETGTVYNLPSITGLDKWALNKGETVTGTLSYALPSSAAYDLTDVDRVDIRFRPDWGYETIYATWQLDKASGHFTVASTTVPPTT